MAFTLSTPVTSIGDTEPASYYDSITITGGQLSMTHTDQFPGTNYGYNGAGTTRSGGPTLIIPNIIDRFPFAADVDSTQCGALEENNGARASGWSAPTAGFICPNYSAFMAKVPFAQSGLGTDTKAQDSGIWRVINNTQHYGTPNSSLTHGYFAGGRNPANSAIVTDFQRFPFACDANAILTTSLTANREQGAAANSSTTGYIAGGRVNTPAPYADSSTILSFPFATTTPQTSVGNLNQNQIGGGTCSTTYAYVAGGSNAVSGYVSRIQKYPFAISSGTATTVGVLSDTSWEAPAQQSATNYGYSCIGLGMTNPNPPATSPSMNWGRKYEKHSFTSDGNSTSVGNLVAGRYGQGCWQD